MAFHFMQCYPSFKINIMIDKKELADLFEEFLNDNSMFWVFKKYIEERGYSLPELGIEDED